MQNYNMSNRQDMQPARRPAAVAKQMAGSLGPIWPDQAPRPMATQVSDHNQINSDIGAMSQQVNSMQSRMNQPQHLRFADLDNRAMVNSGMGLQMDGGNLPSSDNQLAFAARQEQRGQRADAQMNSVMNPAYHNGIKVNPAAVAANLSMSAGDKQNLADNGWGVTSGGVIQKSVKKTGSGQAIGHGSLSDTARQLYDSRMASGMYDGRGMSKDQILAEIAQDVAKARSRYGLSPDGTDRETPRGREQLIASRTDLTDAQKEDYLGRAFARRRAMGRDIPNSVINALGDGPTSGVQNMPRYNPMRGSALSVAEVARGQAGPGQGNAMAGPQDPVRAEAPMPISATTPGPRGKIILRTDDMRLGGPLRDPLEDDSNLSDQEVIDRRYGEGGAAGAGRLPGDDKVIRDPLTGRAGVMSNDIARPLPPGQESRGRMRYENAAGMQPTPGQAAAGMSQQGTYGQPQAPGQMAAQVAQQDMFNPTPANMQDGTSLGQYAQGYADQRARRMGQANALDQRWDGVRQQQAMAQQQAMIGQIAQAAMMGNPQAAQMMQTIQSGNRDAAQMAMEQARLQQEGMFNQQKLGLEGRRNELLAGQTQSQMDIAAEAGRRQDEMRQATIAHNQNMERMQQEALAARQRADAEMDPIRKRNAEAEAQAAELAVKQADFQFEQQQKEAGYTANQEYNKKVSGYAQQIGATGVPQEMARMQAKAMASEEALTEMAMRDSRAASLLDVAPPGEEIASGSPVEKVDDVFARMNQKLNMFPATYGGGFFTSGVPVDGSGGFPENREMLWHALNIAGVTDTDLRQFLSKGRPRNVGMFGSDQDVLANAKEFAAKQNMARHLLGMDIVPFNEEDQLRMIRLTPRG